MRFVVETTLAGEDRIKEYLIGVEVFDRPQEDGPTVRIEAGRLRKRLAEHYGGPGAIDPILIELPKGCDVPFFSECSNGCGLKTTELNTLADACDVMHVSD